jgi:hypothetical protein
MIILLLVVLSSIWVLIDARKIGVRRGLLPGLGDTGPLAWSMLTLFVWIVGFPLYLIYRGKYKAAVAAQATHAGPVLAAVRPSSHLPGWFTLLVLAVVGGAIWYLATGDDAGTGNSSSAPSVADVTPHREPTPQATTGGQDFTLVAFKVKYDEEGTPLLTGLVRNNTDHAFSYVQISFNLYDKQGDQIGSDMVNVNNLAAHGTWKFSTPTMYDHAASVKVAGITGF